MAYKCIIIPSRNAVEDGSEIVETESEENFGRKSLELHDKVIGLVRCVQKLTNQQQRAYSTVNYSMNICMIGTIP